MIKALKDMGKLKGDPEIYRQVGLKGIQFKKNIEDMSPKLARKLLPPDLIGRKILSDDIEQSGVIEEEQKEEQKEEPEQMEGQGDMKAYCVKCKSKREIVDGKISNGKRRMLKGKCGTCGTRMVRFLKKGEKVGGSRQSMTGVLEHTTAGDGVISDVGKKIVKKAIKKGKDIKDIAKESKIVKKAIKKGKDIAKKSKTVRKAISKGKQIVKKVEKKIKGGESCGCEIEQSAGARLSLVGISRGPSEDTTQGSGKDGRMNRAGFKKVF